ncbi:MAG: glycosyltransferase family 4 protein [Pseudomonadota bacterium]|nr:glycosyltransferase family 4 protein [Pseudomonadota bacterium]
MSTLSRRGVAVAAVILNDGELRRRLQEAGIQVFFLPEPGVSAPRLLFGLVAAIRKWKPDVVHTHRIKENILGSIAACLCGLPSVRTVHGATELGEADRKSLRQRALTAANRWCGLWLQRKIISVSAHLGSALASEYGAARVTVIPNGIETAMADSNTGGNTLPNRNHVTVCFVGRVVPVKRGDIFLEMAAMLVRNRPDIQWSFHVFGDGPLRHSLEASAPHTASVTFHGHVASPWTMQKMDVLVICSDHEGVPMAALEAVVAGVAVVAHAVGGLPELLQSLPGCRLVQNHAAGAYAAAVSDVLDCGARPSAAHLPVQYTAEGNATSVRQLYALLTMPGRVGA